jgi:hypothetical protein
MATSIFWCDPSGAIQREDFDSRGQAEAVLRARLDCWRATGCFVYGSGNRYTITDCYGVLLSNVEVRRRPRIVKVQARQ